jgi:hypothetical protein
MILVIVLVAIIVLLAILYCFVKPCSEGECCRGHFFGGEPPRRGPGLSRTDEVQTVGVAPISQRTNAGPLGSTPGGPPGGSPTPTVI